MREYPNIIGTIVGRFLTWNQRDHLKHCALTHNNKYLLGETDRIGKLIRVDLEKLGVGETIKYCKIPCGNVKNLEISPDGRYCLALLEISKKKSYKKRALLAMPESQKPPHECFRKKELFLIDLETEESVVILRKPAIMSFGFIRSGDCFYVWHAPGNFEVYDLKNICQALTFKELSKLVELEAILKTNGRKPLTPDQCTYQECLKAATARTGDLELEQEAAPVKKFSPFSCVVDEKVCEFDAHDVLGIPANASPEEVERAFSARKEKWFLLRDSWFRTGRQAYVEKSGKAYIEVFRKKAKYTIEGTNYELDHIRETHRERVLSTDNHWTSGLEDRIIRLERAYRAMLMKADEANQQSVAAKPLPDGPQDLQKKNIQNSLAKWLRGFGSHEKQETHFMTSIPERPLSPLTAFPSAFAKIKNGVSPFPSDFLEVSCNAPQETVHVAWKTVRAAWASKIESEPALAVYEAEVIGLLDSAYYTLTDETQSMHQWKAMQEYRKTKIQTMRNREENGDATLSDSACWHAEVPQTLCAFAAKLFILEMKY